MNYIGKDTIKKIGFCHILDMLSISSVYGRSEFDSLKPAAEPEKLAAEYDNIAKCIPLVKIRRQFEKFTDILTRFKDIRNTFKRCMEGKVLDEVELYEIKYFIGLSTELKVMYEKSGIQIENMVLYEFSSIYRLLNPVNTKMSSFHIYDEYSGKLHGIRCMKRKYDRNIFMEKDRLLQKKMYEKRQNMAAQEKEEEFNIRKKLSLGISKYAHKLLEETVSIGKLDFLIAKSKLVLDYNMCRPEISEDEKLIMNMGRNPMVETEVIGRGGRFSPVSIEISRGTTVITGANMGGKTVLLSTIALNYIMASLGFYTFAHYFEFMPMDFIYFLSEDSESLENGLSTFGGEIIKLKDILKKIKSGRGLVIIDEFARGTNPDEGSCITKALVGYLDKFDSMFVMSTHYDGVGAFAKFHYQVRGLKYVDFDLLHRSVEDEEDCMKIINDNMDYTLELVDENASVPKDAVNLCRLIGIDEEIIAAAEVLYNKEGKNEEQT